MLQGNQVEIRLTSSGRVVMYAPSGGPAGIQNHILFTAPHSITLKRDGDVDHPLEDYTRNLCRVFAQAVGGVACTWSLEEQTRVLALSDPDPTNRDPNYLTNDEARKSSNPWLYAMNRSHEMFGFDAYAVHIDLHGMTRLRHNADLCVGYTAARRHLNWTPVQGQVLENSVLALLGTLIPGRFVKDQPVGSDQFVICFNITPPGISMGGDWGAERNTMTQQSTNTFWGIDGWCFKCALQLEMSLRKFR